MREHDRAAAIGMATVIRGYAARNRRYVRGVPLELRSKTVEVDVLWIYD
jgi:hypothetical protein